TGLDDSTPILAINSRLVDQRGFDLFAPQVPALIKAGYRIVVTGSGIRKYEEQMLRFREQHPGTFHWSRVIDDGMAHRLAAGADFYLMPSKYEPCGLNQMISMRYGTIPIVRETGGLIDTVIPYNASTGEGTGFGFRDYTPEALMAVALLALEVFRQPEKLDRLRRKGMAQDFSFGRPARAYLTLAEEIAAAHRGPRGVPA
ncbi:MAG: starch synthase, partial [bacterium]